MWDDGDRSTACSRRRRRGRRLRPAPPHRPRRARDRLLGRAGRTGRGYATEAARRLTDIAFAEPDVDRVEIRHDVTNLPAAGSRPSSATPGRRAPASAAPASTTSGATRRVAPRPDRPPERRRHGTDTARRRHRQPGRRRRPRVRHLGNQAEWEGPTARRPNSWTRRRLGVRCGPVPCRALFQEAERAMQTLERQSVAPVHPKSRRPAPLAGRVLPVGRRQEVGDGAHRHHADGLRVRPHAGEPEGVPRRRGHQPLRRVAPRPAGAVLPPHGHAVAAAHRAAAGVRVPHPRRLRADPHEPARPGPPAATSPSATTRRPTPPAARCATRA